MVRGSRQISAKAFNNHVASAASPRSAFLNTRRQGRSNPLPHSECTFPYRRLTKHLESIQMPSTGLFGSFREIGRPPATCQSILGSQMTSSPACVADKAFENRYRQLD